MILISPTFTLRHSRVERWGHWEEQSTRSDSHRSHPPSAASATIMPANSNPYVSSTPLRNSSSKIRDVLRKWGKKAAEATKKAENLAGNMWQHLKTSPNVADAAVARISHGTKVLAEGGYEKVFHQTFQTTPEEQLQKTYACYLSTSVGPIMRTLYLSTSKLAFCSDNPLSYQAGEKMEWSYYKSDDDCCNSCEDVREAYRKKGWALTNPDLIDQRK